MIQLTAAFTAVYTATSAKFGSTAPLYTLVNRFQVNRQSIGSYSNRRPIVACDRYQLAFFEACGLQ